LRPSADRGEIQKHLPGELRVQGFIISAALLLLRQYF
jgi:hypothetical protein